MMRRRHIKQKGFTVIEALAAVALVALVFLPLLILQGQLSRAAMATQRAELSMQTSANAMAFLQTVNPLMVASGEEDLGVGVMVWRAEPISERLPVRDGSGREGRYTTQLFRIDVTITYDNGYVSEFSVDKVGWRAERPLLE